ncbi:hypothetical protein HanPI659440_Chr04g0175831 [Helianthus annuus]|nr:hypothetical protein HanPI659440_Chr04g0175831 [Helianthus annuus]
MFENGSWIFCFNPTRLHRIHISTSWAHFRRTILHYLYFAFSFANITSVTAPTTYQTHRRSPPLLVQSTTSVFRIQVTNTIYAFGIHYNYFFSAYFRCWHNS